MKDPADVSGRLWIACAVLVASAHAFLVCTLSARGLTFYWDDWLLLDRLGSLARPASWFVPHNQHWVPIQCALLDLEHALFRGDHTLYLVVQWAIHSANVALLALLLRARCGDARAAALAAAAFGVSPIWREVLWFVTDTQILLSCFFTLAGFLAAERARDSGSRAWLAAACVAMPLAAMSWGGGLALGPALALEAFALAPRSERLRRALPYALTWLAYVAVYLLVVGRSAGGTVARSPEQLRGAWLFFVEVIGLGFVQRLPLLAVGEGPLAGLAFALLYAALVALAAYVLSDRERSRLLLAHAYLVAVIAPMALARWYHNDREHDPLAAASRYQYLPALAWTTLLALLVAKRPTRSVLAASVVAVILLAIGHARVANRDFGPFSPRGWRASGLAWVRGLEGAARSARGPLFDLRAPPVLAPPEIRASRILRIVAPDVAPVWTSTRSPETVEPLRVLQGS